MLPKACMYIIYIMSGTIRVSGREQGDPCGLPAPSTHLLRNRLLESLHRLSYAFVLAING